MTTREVVLVDGTRTAFGRMGGTIRDFFTSQLGGIAIKGLVEKTNIAEKINCSITNLFLLRNNNSLGSNGLAR